MRRADSLAPVSNGSSGGLDGGVADAADDSREISDEDDAVDDSRGSPGVIVLSAVDNSGSWGRGGFFSALDARSREPAVACKPTLLA